MAKKPVTPTLAAPSPRTAGQDTPLDTENAARQQTAKTNSIQPDTMPPGESIRMITAVTDSSAIDASKASRIAS